MNIKDTEFYRKILDQCIEYETKNHRILYKGIDNKYMLDMAVNTIIGRLRYLDANISDKNRKDIEVNMRIDLKK